jgi:hypothetical protein
MTFLELQDRVMDRLNLSTDAARARLSSFLNERLRNVQTSCNLGRTRRGTVEEDTTPDDTDLVVTSAIKPFTISMADNRPALREVTVDQIRNLLPTQAAGRPTHYAVKSFQAGGFTLELYPKPEAVYTLVIDGLLAGADLVDDTDVPGFPEDFHDILIFGAMADEYDHFDKPEQAMKQESKFEKRLRDLRYFLAKSTYLTRIQGGSNTQVLWWRI